MKKAYRVKREAEFQKVFNDGKSIANRQFVVYVLEKENQTHFRVGLSVGKRIGNAVIRNSVKRKIRQSLLELKQELSPNKDFLVIARKPAANLAMPDFKKCLSHALKKADLFK